MCIDGMFGMFFFVKMDVSRLHGKFQTCHLASHPLLFGSIFIGIYVDSIQKSLSTCVLYIDLLYIIVFIYYLNKFVFIIYIFILHTYMPVQIGS